MCSVLSSFGFPKLCSVIMGTNDIDGAAEEKKKGIIQKRVHPGALEAKKGNVFLTSGRGAVRAHLENTFQRLSPTPNVSGQHTRSLFSVFKSATRSNCSAENEGLCEYPFQQRNQEGTPCPRLEVYPLPIFNFYPFLWSADGPDCPARVSPSSHSHC